MGFTAAGNFLKKSLGHGTELFVHATPKFKTITLKGFLRGSMRGDVTATALLPSVLRRGTEVHPTLRDVTRHLESLYGASFSADVLKIGEEQVLSFRVEVLGDAYVSKRGGIFPRAAEFLAQVLFRPMLGSGGDRFPEYVVDQEKTNHRRLIESLINNKISYAAERLIQEMCKGEPFARYEYGDVSDLAAIDGASLRRLHLEILRRAPFSLFVVGDVDPETTAATLLRALPLDERAGESIYPPSPMRKPAGRTRVIVEEEDVTQGKLALGFRTEIEPGDPKYFALVVANSLLGGGPFSKLFKNVREKASLAYYASSALERSKGVLVVQSGIEPSHFERALRIIKRQVKDIALGRISAEELTATRRGLAHRVRAVEDSAAQLINSTFEGIVAGRLEPTARLLSLLKRVTRAEVVEAARTLGLDTVYFLTRAGRSRAASSAALAGAGAARQARSRTPRLDREQNR